MSLQFTTLEEINVVLKPRLQMGGTQTAYGRGVIPSPDVEAIACRVEGGINMRLKERYKVPLNLTDENAKKLLASITINLTVCEVLGIYYTGMEPSDESGRILSQFCTQGQKELDALMASYIDGEVAIGVSIGATNRAPVVGMRTGGTKIDF
ncbi:hypothetical protein [Phormidium tenue]|uniref:Uncharacterized protein n=1 Tax=Phormidium tenue FACHB-1050 TaxID=2692857 RepID=A0ABR8C8V0_9CYAN|nr:hypothetical protein [Phormidium tenue]MBD2316672.1 hypothetical protein [Phormidium tenue FACHB-1050]